MIRAINTIMIGIDTFSWTKIFLLFDAEWADLLTELISETRFFITTDVEKELRHFHTENESIWRSGAILPRLNRSFSTYRLNGFDDADASLLEYAELPEYTIVTEDTPMLSENVVKRSNLIQLIDLFRKYYENNLLTSKEYRKLIHWFREKRNITKRKAEKLLSSLQNL